MNSTPASSKARGNPVGVGLVASLSNPGGNVTGFSDMHADLGGKYVEFAIELGKPQAPVDYLWYSGWADGQHRLQVTERAAQLLGVKLRTRAITDIAEASDAFAAIKAGEAVTVIIQSSPFSYRHREQLISSAMKRGLGAIYAHPQAARGRIDRVWTGLHQFESSGCLLRRANTQRYEARGPSGTAAHEVRTSDQSQDR